MTREKLDTAQLLQEEEYGFPYHYIPTSDDGFSQVRHWSWGHRYLGGMEVVFDQLRKRCFHSLVDIGCGDGRFLREARVRFPEAELLGVDYSEQAIRLARAMNPELKFQAINIIEERLSQQFDVATCLEVLEHIPPGQVQAFCDSTADAIEKDGWLVLTVPHTNKWVSPKHYQHFSSTQLEELLAPYFYNITFVPFDPRSRFVMSVIERFMGGTGKNFVVTNSRINSWFYRLYRKRYLYAGSEEECWRIAVVGNRR